MTREEALAALKDCIADAPSDREGAHEDADRVLCDLLRALGYQDVVDAWASFGKWYA